MMNSARNLSSFLLPGVTPAAVALLNVFIEIQSRQRKQASSPASS